MALRGLPRMFSPQDCMHYFRVRKEGTGVVPEGWSRRYAAITLIGLATEEAGEATAALDGVPPAKLMARIVNDLPGVNNLGDVALAGWAAAAMSTDRDAIWKRIAQLDPVSRSHPTVEIAWALAAACLDGTPERCELAHKLAARLVAAFPEKAAVFPHVIGDGGARSHVACFADMVYPIHALAKYAGMTGDRKALQASTLAAKRICDAQGPAGQWWWHYDARTGDVIEGYPVYAIHQDAMGPMALFELAANGGPDLSPYIQRGLDWLWHAPEIDGSLIDPAAGLIWRKVARREPGKLSRYAQAGASWIHPSMRVPGLGSLFAPGAIDFEDRPYHLGWLLYAWPAERARRWDEGTRS